MAESKVKEEKDPLPEQFNSIETAVEFWDTHSLADYEEAWKDVECEIDISCAHIRSQSIAAYIRNYASLRARGVSAETLVNLWLQEKV